MSKGGGGEVHSWVDFKQQGLGTPTAVLADITNEHGKENCVKIIKQFQPGLSKIAPTKKGGEKKKGCSAINKVVTREYTINVHRYIMGWASRRVPSGTPRD